MIGYDTPESFERWAQSKDFGLVELDKNDRANLTQMPLGYWAEIDDVDERERRRILGARFMGWRDFYAEDRRPCPPR